MSAVITTPEDIVNAALERIGRTERVGNLLEGSEASKIALDIYGQTRDEKLRQGDWAFARRDIIGTLLKSAPALGYIPPDTTWNPQEYPPLPWRFEYAYPSDCLKVRSMRPQTIFVQEFDPQPVLFSEVNDPYATGTDPDFVQAKVIVCNVAEPIITYTGQVFDPRFWEVSFVELMIDSMAKLMAPALANAQVTQMAAVGEVVQTAKASQVQG